MDVLLIKILILLFSTNPVYKNTPVFNENKCAECHADYAVNKVNHPAAESCDNCHQSNGKEHPASGEKCFTLAQTVPALCYNCHEAKNTKTTKHSPVDGGECLTCHSPHSSANKTLLTDYPASNLCKMCHEFSFDDKKSVHKPVTDGRCVECHDPHQSDQAKLLKKESKELCLGCHNKSYNNGAIDNISLALKSGNTIHGAIEGDGCLTCHKGHASDKSKLLTDAFPLSSYTNGSENEYALCFTCHDSQIMKLEKTTSGTQFRNGDKNIHYLHLTGTKSRSCAVCHNVHGSPNAHLINNEVSFGKKWKMKMNFIGTETGGGCLPGCHQEEKYDRVNPVIKEVKIFENINKEDNSNSNTEVEALEKKKFEEEMARAKEADEEARRLAGEKNRQVQNNENNTLTEPVSEQKVNESNIISDEKKKEGKNIEKAKIEEDSDNEDEMEESEIIKLNSIKFDTDSVMFSASFEKELNKVAKTLKKNPEWKVEVQGYTDNVGSELYNIALSLKRAKQAKVMLVKEGIAEDRISTVGYGESNPIKSNDTEKGRLINRRIEFKFIYK